MTREDLIKSGEGHDLRIGVTGEHDGHPMVVVHLHGLDSATLDFVIVGDELRENPNVVPIASED